jgi:RecB family endonuclease NucS
VAHAKQKSDIRAPGADPLRFGAIRQRLVWSAPPSRLLGVRLIVARCEVSYIGRLTTVLPEAVRLLMHKADGTFMVWADGGGPNV